MLLPLTASHGGGDHGGGRPLAAACGCQITQVLTGGAQGAARLGYRWAWKHTVKHQRFRAEWERFGKAAGVRRNY